MTFIVINSNFKFLWILMILENFEKIHDTISLRRHQQYLCPEKFSLGHCSSDFNLTIAKRFFRPNSIRSKPTVQIKFSNGCYGKNSAYLSNISRVIRIAIDFLQNFAEKDENVYTEMNQDPIISDHLGKSTSRCTLSI